MSWTGSWPITFALYVAPVAVRRTLTASPPLTTW